MLYLLDSNTLITANNTYYPIDTVPEFWEWVEHQGNENRIKLPIEMIEEITVGKKEDRLTMWIKSTNINNALLLSEEAEQPIVQKVVNEGYASDLSDYELEAIGRDPFLISYALGNPNRCIVTVETSSPKKQRQNRKVPDVCSSLGIACCDPFKLYRDLGFKTSWKSQLPSRV